VLSIGNAARYLQYWMCSLLSIGYAVVLSIGYAVWYPWALQWTVYWICSVLSMGYAVDCLMDMQCSVVGICSGVSKESAVCCPWDIWCAFSGILGKHQQIFTLQSFNQFWEDKNYI
jgi:hypothetical protein